MVWRPQLSVGIQSLIWKAGPPHKAELLLLLAIADHAGDDGYAYPGVALLAKKSRDTTRNVLRVLPKLVLGGWLTIEQRPGRLNGYRVGLAKIIPLALATGDKMSSLEQRVIDLFSDKMSPVIDDTPDILGIAPVTFRDKTPDILGSLYRGTIKQPSTETKVPKTSLLKASSFELPLWVDPKAWADYMEVRKKKRALCSPNALNAVVDRLDEFRSGGHNVNEILTTSFRSNWTDVYEPKSIGASRGAYKSKGDANLDAGRNAIAALEAHGDYPNAHQAKYSPASSNGERRLPGLCAGS